MAARLPVIVCGASGADPRTVAALAALADRFGIAVAENQPRYVNFPSSHELHAGYELQAVMADADMLLFLECDVPWLPGQARPRSDAFIAHAGADPQFSRYPLRSFPADLVLTADAASLIDALGQALQAKGASAGAVERRARAAGLAQRARTAVQERAQRDLRAGGAITKLFLSRCIDEVRARDSIVINEYPAVREQMSFDEAGTFFLHSPAAGLGWGLPAALGAKQAAPARDVIAVLGDGAYLFCNPAVCHQASQMHALPVLTVVFDNGGWDAVQKSALAMYPKTHAAAHRRANGMAPLSSLAPLPDFIRYIEASDGHGERVERREDLVPALRRALEWTRREKRQALVHVLGETKP